MTFKGHTYWQSYIKMTKLLTLLYIAEYIYYGQLRHFIPGQLNLKSPAAINKWLLGEVSSIQSLGDLFWIFVTL